nr:uncharacterized protein CI109_000730 [Kwoniella shandongensis]KAA5531158.1 hypothetical protein CI109_000730 [Kwoniella shandongensis]
MVSTRPSPTPARGRIAYPSAANYTPGDADNSPAYLGASGPIHKTTSRDSDRERAQGLKTWWKGFREKERAEQSHTGGLSKALGNVLMSGGRGVFGVPLSESIEYASVQVSTSGPDGSLYVWGVIPIVVAKCGLYLKDNATHVEGTFRVSGSAKRMRELQTLFDSGPKYGKNVDWKSLPYTTHDVATIFRRFLTQMPEPIVPFEFYDEFRNVQTMLHDNEISVDEAIVEYKHLIQALPRTNLYLLLYVLDLLSVFSRRSDKNLMTAPNLALIFQPGVISHPLHTMRPREHVLSQQVLEFLIEHQDHFLLGMELKPRSKKRHDKVPSPGPTSPETPSVPTPPAPVKADADLMLPSDSDDEAPAGGYYVIERQEPVSPPTSPPTQSLPSLEAKLVPPPPEPVRPKPTIDFMEPSDSDEDAPPGGYEVRSGDFTGARATMLGKGHVAPSSQVSLTRRRTVPSRPGGGLVTRIRRAAKEAP